MRLEQGRERHPSAQVVDALARALGLEEDATAHLHRLARPVPRRRRPAVRPERVSPNLLRMMESWPHTPAVVLGRYMAVLAANTLGRALFDGHTYSGDLLPAAVYCATKYAAWAIAEGLRLEADPSIRVTTVSPGVVESELADTISEPGAKEAMRAYRAASISADAIAAPSRRDISW